MEGRGGVGVDKGERVQGSCIKSATEVPKILSCVKMAILLFSILNLLPI